MKKALCAVLCIISALFVTLLLRINRAITQERLGETHECDGSCLDKDEVKDGSSFGTTRESLTLRDKMPERVSGTFVRDGMSLDFEAVTTDKARTLVLRSRSGEVLLDFHMDLAGGGRAATYLGGRMKVEVDAAFIERLQVGVASDASGIVVHGDKTALGELASRPEYRLLAYLSQSLGQQGVTGNVYPATLSLHILGMRVAGDLGIFADKPAMAARLKQCGGGAVMEIDKTTRVRGLKAL